MTFYCPRELTFPWQPCFDMRVFENVYFLYFKIKQQSLHHSMIFLLVLITFEPILDGFFF